jgi:phosphate:Na+ symporter
MPIVRSLVGVDANGVILNPAQGIAWTHTLFNVFNTIVFLPFTAIAADLLTRYVPESPGPPAKSRLTSLSTRIVETASIAIERSHSEVLRMANICDRLTQWVLDIIKSETPETKVVDASFHDEEVLDSLQDEIIEFTSSILSGNISHEIAENARQQLRMADELESISDYLIVILKSDLKMRKSGLSLPDPEKSEVISLHTAIVKMIQTIVKYYAERKSGHALLTEIQGQGRGVTRKVKEIRDTFMRRMSEEKFDPQVVIALNTQLNAYRRVREHAQNVAEAIIGIR